MGLTPPPRMLDAQLFPPLSFQSSATFRVRAEKPDGTVAELGETGKDKEPVKIPRHRAWWVFPVLQVRRRYNSSAAARPEQLRLLRDALDEVAERRLPGLAHDGDFEPFHATEGLQHLEYFTGDPGTDLTPVVVLERLRRLQLHDVRDLGPLREMRELTTLWLEAPAKASCGQLPPTICRLFLGRCNDEFLAGIERLPALTHVQSLSGIGDAGARHLARARSFSELNLENSDLTDAGVRALVKGLPGVEVLGLRGSGRITDKGVAALGALGSLRRLDLDNCPKVTAKGLSKLAALTDLEVLYVRAVPRLTADRTKARMALREALPKCKIY